MKILIQNEELMNVLDTGNLVYHLSLVQVSYCKTIFASLQKKSIKQQQLIQDITVCVRTETWKVDLISPALRSFHSLPVSQRVVFKILLLVYLLTLL